MPTPRAIQPTSGRGKSAGDALAEQGVKEQIEDLKNRIAALEAQLVDLVQFTHATLLIPRTVIEPGSLPLGPGFTFNDYTRFAGLPVNFGTITSTSDTEILNYEGRGVLNRLAVGTVAAAGSTATALTIKVYIDDIEVYSGDVGCNTATGKIAMLVGGMVLDATTAAPILGGFDCPIGLPFNKSLRITLASNTAGQGVSAAWKLAKKR